MAHPPYRLEIDVYIRLKTSPKTPTINLDNASKAQRGNGCVRAIQARNARNAVTSFLFPLFTQRKRGRTIAPAFTRCASRTRSQNESSTPLPVPTIFPHPWPMQGGFEVAGYNYYCETRGSHTRPFMPLLPSP